MNNSNRYDIQVVVTGDLCLEGRIEGICAKKNYNELFQDTIELFKNVDMSLTNLESPLTDHLDPIEKSGPNLCASEKCVELLKYADISVAALANNHIMDQNEAGLLNTLKVCNFAGIKTVGAGKDIEEASRPIYLEIKELKICIVNICENEFASSAKNKAGANPLDIPTNFHQIKNARDKCDYLIVFYHGGIEHFPYPTPQMVKNLRFFVDIGADVVIASHTHIVSGYEFYHDKFIFYGLGNFIFDRDNESLGWDEGIILKLIINRKNCKTEFEIFPIKQDRKNNLTLSLMKGKEKESFLDDISEKSKIIADEEKLIREWKAFIDIKSRNIISAFLPMIPLKRRLLQSKKIPNRIKTVLLGLNNTIRCESLREMCLESFDNFFKNRR